MEPKIFDAPASSDPFATSAKRGARLLVVCRHTREKSVHRLLAIFARHVLPKLPHASLTLVGDGPDHASLKRLAAEYGVLGSTYFAGEQPLTDMPRFYAHADLFLYASLSETYGQVVSEALWSGLPVVAFADDMGVSDQVEHGVSGALIRPEGASADAEFGATVVRLLAGADERRTLATRAAQRTRARVHPRGVVERYYDIFEAARDHCRSTTEQRIRNPLAGYSAVGRWALVQSLLLGLGCVRRPAKVKSHGSAQPSWDALEH